MYHVKTDRHEGQFDIAGNNGTVLTIVPHNYQDTLDFVRGLVDAANAHLESMSAMADPTHFLALACHCGDYFGTSKDTPFNRDDYEYNCPECGGRADSLKAVSFRELGRRTAHADLHCYRENLPVMYQDDYPVEMAEFCAGYEEED